MYNQSDMTIHFCSKLSEDRNDLILLVEPGALGVVHSHHKLKVVDNDMSDVMHIHSM